ncbi:MAG: hypothetical protein K2Z81_08285, partial [Cyanobacteria bacterium]|nr:hypothetical protein [Cyanobacteriota bacterium]
MVVILLYAPASFAELKPLTPQMVVQSGPDYTFSLALSPDERLLAAGGMGNIILWDMVHGKRVKVLLSNNEKEILFLAFSPNGDTLASVSLDRTIKLWEPRTGKLIHTFCGHVGVPEAIGFNADGTKLFSVSFDTNFSSWKMSRTIKTWDLASGKEASSNSIPVEQVDPVCFSPDCRILASGHDGALVLSEVASGQVLRTIGNPLGGARTGAGGTERPKVCGINAKTITALSFSPSGRLVTDGTLDGTIRLWAVSSGNKVLEL